MPVNSHLSIKPSRDDFHFILDNRDAIECSRQQCAEILKEGQVGLNALIEAHPDDDVIIRGNTYRLAWLVPAHRVLLVAAAHGDNSAVAELTATYEPLP